MSGRKSQELEGITLLGNQKTKYPDDYAPEVLELSLIHISEPTRH